MRQKSKSSRSLGIAGVLISILLVLAFLVTSMPQSVQAADPTPTPTDPPIADRNSPSLTVSFTRSYVVVNVTNFSPWTKYYVRAVNGNLRSSVDQWFTMGRVRTNKNGVVKFIRRFPKPLVDTSIFSICLKDTDTDEALCQTVSNR
jgi:hypothetical protein